MSPAQAPFGQIRRALPLLPLLALLVLLVGGVTLPADSARAEGDDACISPAALAARSPVAERVLPLEAVRQARLFVAAHPGTDFMVGSGDSMLPLYKDHTVIVTRRIGIRQLRPGMTVVFMDPEGFAVAHVLVRLTSSGWISMGVGNADCDRGRVVDDNYVGVVIRAFEPTGNPLQALLERSPGAAPANPSSSVAGVRVAPKRPAVGARIAAVLP
jgi:hypothetical protein